MTLQTLRFSYKLSAMRATLMVVVALGVTAGLGYIAYANPDSRYTRLFARVLSPEIAPYFWWGLTFLALIASAIVIWFAIRSQSAPPYVELGPTNALVPQGSLTMVTLAIPYSAITQIQILNIPGQQMAVISSPFGTSRLISKSFKSPGEFTSFIQALQGRRLK